MCDTVISSWRCFSLALRTTRSFEIVLGISAWACSYIRISAEKNIRIRVPRSDSDPPKAQFPTPPENYPHPAKMEHTFTHAPAILPPVLTPPPALSSSHLSIFLISFCLSPDLCLFPLIPLNALISHLPSGCSYWVQWSSMLASMSDVVEGV